MLSTSNRQRGAISCAANWRDPVDPLIAIICDMITQPDIALVPLVCRDRLGARLVEFDGRREALGKLAALDPGEAGRRAASPVALFRVEFVRNWTLAAALWDNRGDGTNFQHSYWLDAWYRAFDSVDPLIAIISDIVTQRHVALVPLICRKHHSVRLVEFADLGVSDYNAPILACGAPRDPASMRDMGRALLAALRGLPDRPDLIRLKKIRRNSWASQSVGGDRVDRILLG